MRGNINLADYEFSSLAEFIEFLQKHVPENVKITFMGDSGDSFHFQEATLLWETKEKKGQRPTPEGAGLLR